MKCGSVKNKILIIPRTIKKSVELIEKGIEFISEKAQMSFDKIGQVVKDKVRIFQKKSPAVPVGEITIHFENLSEDLDLTGLITDTDFEKQKTIFYMESWPNVIERSKIYLYQNDERFSIIFAAYWDNWNYFPGNEFNTLLFSYRNISW